MKQTGAPSPTSPWTRTTNARYPVIAISVAYEIEIAGVIQPLELSGIPALAEQRTAQHPFILCGGSGWRRHPARRRLRRQRLAAPPGARLGQQRPAATSRPAR